MLTNKVLLGSLLVNFDLKEDNESSLLCVGPEQSTCRTKKLQSCPTLCNPIEYSPPGSSVHGIFQLFISSQLNNWASVGKESACNAGNPGSIPGSGRSPGEGKGYPLQYSGLENPMDCRVHRGHKESDTTEHLSPSLPFPQSGGGWC